MEKRECLVVVALVGVMAWCAYLAFDVPDGAIVPRSPEVQFRDGKYGQVVWVNSDLEHWEEDGRKVHEVASAKLEEAKAKGLPATMRQTDVNDGEKKIYIRRIHIDFDK